MGLVAEKTKINASVTISHIIVTFTFTVSQASLVFFVYKPKVYNRIEPLCILFGVIADMFLSIMVWFILDDQSIPIAV